ncbi:MULTISPECIES: glycoside hydrolase family 19 protein [Klebsiella]|uniref:glycoside hydrolase family 19 protein n=1 Tax=Klebsiella TaxID=570 RepID=UPI001CD01759|nr:glycoside hydrolase family 19 protein [Klebsiella oxytoca]MBZ7725614.1 glycoside hydrolase family 19 protein [Klebsiella oxytoca]UWC76415.1 glycoside hydrolase family 19 protein [Klebsiella oxytoca]HED1534268.1 glycoside hydrolase family 19 protein [Klebsiella oxytoca]HED2240363.1 glycoside hydrolase family 19 protein [Klebsiella oxytoca]HED2307482.1 glycoside hydrolase family 19 protein [Klebsiella oxytoca]
MTKDQFMKAAGLSQALADKWYQHIIDTMKEFGIDTPKRQAHFIAQVGTESNGFRAVQESLNYSVTGLQIFGSRLTAVQREKLGRKPGELALSPARQADIANIVYGGRYGNNQSGDGWKYRGRGLKQVTFKDNYSACGKVLGLNLIDDPDLLLLDKNAARSAGWFWKANNCNQFADSGDVNGLTKRINGGFNGLQDRAERTRKAEAVLI